MFLYCHYLQPLLISWLQNCAFLPPLFPPKHTQSCRHGYVLYTEGVGEGGVTLDLMRLWWNDQMGAKIKTQTIPGLKMNPPKIPCQISQLRGQDMQALPWGLPQIFRLFWIPQKSLLKLNHTKKVLAKFSYLKKSWNRKFQIIIIFLYSAVSILNQQCFTTVSVRKIK